MAPRVAPALTEPHVQFRAGDPRALMLLGCPGGSGNGFGQQSPLVVALQVTNAHGTS